LDANIERVLVLNSSYIPIYLSTPAKAIKKLIKKKAEVITIIDNYFLNHPYEDWIKYSKSKKLEWDETKKYRYWNLEHGVLGIPKIIRLKSYSKIPVKLRINRKNILLRDNYICTYCNKKKQIGELNVDHIEPKSKGGKNTWENLSCSCVKCNSHKRDRTPKEAGMKLHYAPKKPTIHLLFKKYAAYFFDFRYTEWNSLFPEEFLAELEYVR